MTPVRWCALAIGVAVVTAATAEDTPKNELPEVVVTALEKAAVVEVYSIQPNHADQGGWHGYKVLGKTEVKKAAEKKPLAAALKKAVDEGVPGARCFIPRHGVRVTHGGKTYDLLICFECHWAYVYTGDSDKPTVLTISEAPQRAMNKILTDAKVELAQPEK